MKQGAPFRTHQSEVLKKCLQPLLPFGKAFANDTETAEGYFLSIYTIGNTSGNCERFFGLAPLPAPGLPF